MIADLKRYPKMKDSGVPWLGEVPAHWELPRLGAVLCERGEINSAERITDVLSVTRDRGVIPYAEKGNVGNKKSDDITRYKIVRPDDIVVNCMNVIIGSVGRSSYTGCLSPVYYVLKRRSLADNPRYLDAYFQTKPFQRSLVRIGNGILAHRMRIPMELLKCEPFPLPPPDEQTAIVRFLDYMDRRIRRYIRAKQKLIKLLEEQKQAIIHRAVTRGLDPSVRLKPSGAEWLGDVPEHWEVRKLKFEMTFRGGGTPSKAESDYWNGDIPWVSPKDMKSDVIHDAADHITERAIRESSTNFVASGSILMVVRSGILQRTIPIAICSRKLALNQDMKALMPKGSLTAGYFVLLVRGSEKLLLTEWTKQGATVESIEHQFLANSKVPIPPQSEQVDIERFVELETQPLTAAIARTEREIDLLREFRTRLIADVVTGKLDVREAAARLPQEAEDTVPLDEVEDDTEEAAEAEDATDSEEEAEA